MERYEISNYARPGLECRHNLVYWERGNYIGFGCAAHSMMNDERFFNPDYRAYLSGAPQSEREPSARHRENGRNAAARPAHDEGNFAGSV